ncbi:MAG: DUF3784 domain-containing protein [Oscillospiraceae bacterium]|nr:DUF3784 domain-containing protein [Oscillospiraceae bacterium]
MRMAKTITAIIIGLIAVASFIISILQFKEKGFLFNNAYIWASKEERQRMDRRPHYRQSGVVFSLIGILFLLLALEVLLNAGWLLYVFWGVVILTVVYAVVSSIKTK